MKIGGVLKIISFQHLMGYYNIPINLNHEHDKLVRSNSWKYLGPSCLFSFSQLETRKTLTVR